MPKRTLSITIFFCMVLNAIAQDAISGASKVADNTIAADTFSIAMTGDIMMGTTFPEISLPPNDGKELFAHTAAITCEADLAVSNLEGTLCDGGTTKKKPSANCYAFRTPTRFGSRLSEAGYDFLSMANNHANDFGTTGIEQTEKTLDSLGIKYSGIKGRARLAVVERKGVRFGICAFGHNSYTLSHNCLDSVKIILDELKEISDIIIVSFHGGAEGSKHTHLPEGHEFYLGEDRGDLRTFAHFCIDNGADVVYGHGPHVVRAMEVYNGRFIAYSLGNFCTPYGMNLAGVNGYAPVVTIRINDTGKFLDGDIHSFIQIRGKGPQPDENKMVVKEIRQLIATDIKDSKINIDDNGKIKLK
ncbi:MAG: CapA family protein [Paludibacteraceae bacterium]|nr:CapA family protein [Paludibacteraceae bacterium]